MTRKWDCGLRSASLVITREYGRGTRDLYDGKVVDRVGSGTVTAYSNQLERELRLGSSVRLP